MTSVAASAHAFREGRKALLAELCAHPSGLPWCRKHSELCDWLLSEVFGAVLESPGDQSVAALIAVGGYGRHELAPFSDVDVIVVPRDEADPRLDRLVRRLHRELQDAFAAELGISLSYAFFLVNDVPGVDPKSRTAMLDARLVCGSKEALRTFQEVFRASFPVGEFLLEKVQEREAAHKKWNDTPLAVEPNLKEGAGGLRSYHCANWIRAAIGLAPLPENRSFNELARIRNVLHCTAGAASDRFTRPRQAEAAELLGLPLEKLVSDAAKCRMELFECYEREKRLIRTARFPILEGVHAENGKIFFEAGATLSGAAQATAIGTKLDLEIGQRAGAASDEIDGPAALFSIGMGEAVLRALDRAGILERLLPELTRCRTLMPEDAVHAYSVFEHTLRTIRQIEGFPPESFYGRLRDGLSSASPLYLAALLHDAGKAEKGRPHSESGTAIARAVADRWKLAPGIASAVEWLVKEHLSMARTIGMRDVSDPRTVHEFAKLVGDRERLDMLTVLTCADVGAVAPEAWTPAQDAFLRELHARTSALFETREVLREDPSLHRRQLLKTLKDHPIPERQVEAFLERLPAHYVVSTRPDLVPLHMELVQKAESGDPAVVWDHDRERKLSQVTIAAPDAPGLLSRILGVLYAFDLSVHGLRASTTSSGPRTALDTVLVSFGHQPAPQATCALAGEALVEVLTGKGQLRDLLLERGKDPDRKQEHYTYQFVPGSPGILEVQAPRGRGMAFRMATMIASAGWNITAARFGQWAGKGAAAFYLLGPDGKPLGKKEVDARLA